MSQMTEVLDDIVGRWLIRHETAYRYDTQVAFAPHVLRLTPQGERVRCMSRNVHVSPLPLTTSDFRDAFGNSCTRISFGSEQASELIVRSDVEVQTLARPLLDGSGLPPLPWYTHGHDELLAYRHAGNGPEVAALAERLTREVGGAPLALFELLNRTLHTTLDRQIRVEGHAQTPAETLRIGRGACRDLTVLFLAVCRHLGVAGRFVSGYQGQEASPDGKRHLHAWPEVFLPGSGWLGWDPTHGVAVGSRHVSLCAAPTQGGTMPIEGGFYFNGPTVTSTLDYSITFEAI
jgi:transglutaminase-like putative cysteine protease